MTDATPDVKSPRVAREATIRAMTQEQLVELAVLQSRQLQEAKALLRVAAKTFRWVQKPTEAQDIDKFLRSFKSE